MTTIAWDTKTLAADTLCTTNDGAPVYGEKIWTVPQGLYGGAGDDPIIEAVLLWLRRGSKPKHRPNLSAECNFTGLVVEHDGRLVILDWHLIPVRYFPQKFAIGTGGNAALALMHCGHTAESAIQKIIAERLDNDTGGTTTTLRLPARRRPRKS